MRIKLLVHLTALFCGMAHAEISSEADWNAVDNTSQESYEFSTRSLYFQGLDQLSAPDEETHSRLRTQFFYHPTGGRFSLEGTVAPISTIPVALHTRALFFTHLENVSQPSLETGLFWFGRNARFKGQLGINYFHEDLSVLESNNFLIPQMTIRSTTSHEGLDSVQHIAFAFALRNKQPNRLHSSHAIHIQSWQGGSTVFSAGLFFDFYWLFGNEKFNLQFPKRSGKEFELIQLLGGPSFLVLHQKFGRLTLQAGLPMLITQQTDKKDSTIWRFFKIPYSSVAYLVSF